VTDTRFEVSDLETGAMYNFFVVSHNKHGTSLPSSVLIINVTDTGMESAAHTVMSSILQKIKKSGKTQLNQLMFLLTEKLLQILCG
jgi:hypothetical protein